MYYFKYNEDNIEKYVVHFNCDELMNLRHVVITNCSELVHREIDTDDEINNNYKIRNLKRRKEGATYHYSYDEYVYPRLVSIINMLLREDDRVFDELINNRQRDIDRVSDKNKQAILIDCYNRIDQLLSFELILIINISDLNKKTGSGQRVRNRKR